MNTEFYTAQTAFARQFDSRSRGLAFEGKTPNEAQLWQQQARQHLSDLLGLGYFESCEARLHQVGTFHLEAENIVRESWLMQTEPDVWMPFYLLVPMGLSQPTPLVLCPHGHGSGGGAMTAGVREHPAIAGAIARSNGDYGLQLARAGFITACPDARGFGRRREPLKQGDADILSSSCHNLTIAGTPLGLTVTGMWTWENMRLLDALSSDSRIDPTRIGCVGLSGGGLQTLYLSALDERVQAAVVSGYFYGVRESLQVLNGNCTCNMVPGLWQAFDMGDIGAMIAPRSLFIESGDSDPLNGASGIGNVQPQVEIARHIFDLRGGKLEHAIFEGPHLWHGQRALPWLQTQLKTPCSNQDTTH